jgi:hypothetical protein
MASPCEEEPFFKSIAPRFQCRDLKQTLAFYADLGFTTTSEDEGFAIVERDRIAIHFNHSTDGECRASVCWIEVTAIEKLYEEFLPTTAVQGPVVAQPYGIKEFFIRDPSRNLIVFAEFYEAGAVSDKSGIDPKLQRET